MLYAGVLCRRVVLEERTPCWSFMQENCVGTVALYSSFILEYCSRTLCSALCSEVALCRNFELLLFKGTLNSNTL